MTSRAYGVRNPRYHCDVIFITSRTSSTRSPRSHYDVILIVTSFATAKAECDSAADDNAVSEHAVTTDETDLDKSATVAVDSSGSLLPDVDNLVDLQATISDKSRNSSSLTRLYDCPAALVCPVLSSAFALHSLAAVVARRDWLLKKPTKPAFLQRRLTVFAKVLMPTAAAEYHCF